MPENLGIALRSTGQLIGITSGEWKMTGKLQFDFIADKTNNTLTIRREFAASRQLVWDCHTKPELLDQWFAPKPMTAKTKEMDLRPGGRWIYCMIDPEGNEYWGRMDYETVTPIDGYTGFDGFCNADGDLNPHLPRSSSAVSFHDKGKHAVVETILTLNQSRSATHIALIFFGPFDNFYVLRTFFHCSGPPQSRMCPSAASRIPRAHPDPAAFPELWRRPS
jgi:hypothetical protein